ncbi:MAG: competence protein TfoX [Rhodobacteraceae bacterium]|nr:MAG: competence protein TfoX [Paracoccaceae bacterium]
MSSPVSSIRNLGPAFEKACAQAGITTAEQLREMGADAAYARLMAHGHRPHFIGYYVLVMGLQGRPWNDCKGKEKEALRARFDALKAARSPGAAARSELDRFLDQIGVIERRR